MLPQSWLLTILLPVALGAPVPQEPSPPTLTLTDSTPDGKVTDFLPKKVFDRANKAGWHHRGNRITMGSKSTLSDQGSPSLDGYPAHGTGVSYSATSGRTSQGPKKMGLNLTNDPDLYLKGQKGQVGSKTALNGKGGSSTGGYAAQGTGVSNSGTLGGTSGESSSYGSGGMTIGSEGTIIGKKGKTTDSKGTAIGSVGLTTGSQETITGSEGTTTGTGTGTTTFNNGTSTLIPQYK